jgi:hypothetical protein
LRIEILRKRQPLPADRSTAGPTPSISCGARHRPLHPIVGRPRRFRRGPAKIGTTFGHVARMLRPKHAGVGEQSLPRACVKNDDAFPKMGLGVLLLAKLRPLLPGKPAKIAKNVDLAQVPTAGAGDVRDD